MRVPVALAGLAASCALGAAAIGIFVWGALLAAKITDEGATPGAVPGYVLVISSFVVATAARFLWKSSHDFAWPHRDSAETFVRLVIVLSRAVFLLALVWIVLRLTHVIGPLVTDRGL